MHRTLALILLTLAAAPAPAAYTRISISGEDAPHGIYDPALEYTAAGDTGWMSYSSVHAPAFVHTNIALTTDNGASWTKVRQVNTGAFDTLTYIDASRIPGAWRHEVSTIVHDPTDPDPAKRWKMFWHEYFTAAPYETEDRMPAYGWIAYRHAPTPAGPWSKTEALFGAGAFPPAPYDFTRTDLNALHADLYGYVAYTEPGSICRNGTLYVSLTCLSPAGADRIILLRSADHAATWEYTGTVVTNTDADLLGYVRFDGSALAVHDGRTFMLCTPGTDALLHDGTLAFEFEDLDRAALLRSAGTAPRIITAVPLPTVGFNYDGFGGGQADYDEYNAAGILMPLFDVTSYPDDLFRIYTTGITPAQSVGISVSQPAVYVPSGRVTHYFGITGFPAYGNTGVIIRYHKGTYRKELRIRQYD